MTKTKSRARDWVFLVVGLVFVLVPVAWIPASPPPEAAEVSTEAKATNEQKTEQPATEPEENEDPADEADPPSKR